MNCRQAKNLKPRTRVVLDESFRTYSPPLNNATVELKRKDAAGAWIAHTPGRAFDETHIGTGNCFRLA